MSKFHNDGFNHALFGMPRVHPSLNEESAKAWLEGYDEGIDTVTSSDVEEEIAQ